MLYQSFTMATTFHPFPRLPFELRAQIWAMVAAPRTVRIRAKRSSAVAPLTGFDYSYTSSTPPPEVRNVCRESRQHARQQKAFFTTVPGESMARYIWVDFQEDMIYFQDHRMSWLAPHEAEIQRLTFLVPEDDQGHSFYDFFFHACDELLQGLTALRELHVALESLCCFYGSAANGRYGACPTANIRFLDLQSGLLLTGPQVRMAYAWMSEKGGLVDGMDYFEEELQFMLDNETGLHLSELAKID